MLRAGRNCWRVERAHRAAVVVDAEDYFRLARQAMLKARSQILLIGWDFDTRICLDFEADDGAPNELGAFITWLPRQRPGLQIHILKWDIGALKVLGRGTTILRLLRWAASDQIHFKLDGAHAAGASHHHKIAVIDDALAFCGGIDMAGSRWDTREHLDDDPHRRRPTTRRPYEPWHDATMAVDGPVAAALGQHSRDRWAAAGGKPLRAPRANSDPWPEDLKPQFEQVDLAIARTRAAFDEEDCIREIEALYIDMIKRAKRFIYAENQYFASRAIAEAIEKRLAEADGPEFVIVNPKSGQGWLDETAMGPARAELFRRLRKADRFDRFRIFTPVTDKGNDIYVHSKITIVDDEMLRVGSANMNNRSMGLDSECDLLLDATRKRNAAAAPQIAALRVDLMAEHLGVSVDSVEAKMAKTGSLVKTIDAFAGGKGRGLKLYSPPKTSAVERKLARNEALDPESAGDAFEPIARPGLLAGIGMGRRSSASG